MYQHGAAFGDIDGPVYWHTWERFVADVMLLYGVGEKEYLEAVAAGDAERERYLKAAQKVVDDILFPQQEKIPLAAIIIGYL